MSTFRDLGAGRGARLMSDVIWLRVHSCLHFTGENTECWQVEPKVSELPGPRPLPQAALPKALQLHHLPPAQPSRFTKGFHIHHSWAALDTSRQRSSVHLRPPPPRPPRAQGSRPETLTLSSSRKSGPTRRHLQICHMRAPQD